MKIDGPQKRRTEQMIWEVLTALVAPGPHDARSVRPGAMITSSRLWNDDTRIASPGSPRRSKRKPPPAMTINRAIVRIVDFCARYRWMIVIAGTHLMLGPA